MNQASQGNARSAESPLQKTLVPNMFTYENERLLCADSRRAFISARVRRCCCGTTIEAPASLIFALCSGDRPCGAVGRRRVCVGLVENAGWMVCGARRSGRVSGSKPHGTLVRTSTVQGTRRVFSSKTGIISRVT